MRTITPVRFENKLILNRQMLTQFGVETLEGRYSPSNGTWIESPLSLHIDEMAHGLFGVSGRLLTFGLVTLNEERKEIGRVAY